MYRSVSTCLRSDQAAICWVAYNTRSSTSTCVRSAVGPNKLANCVRCAVACTALTISAIDCDRAAACLRRRRDQVVYVCVYVFDLRDHVCMWSCAPGGLVKEVRTYIIMGMGRWLSRFNLFDSKLCSFIVRQKCATD